MRTKIQILKWMKSHRAVLAVLLAVALALPVTPAHAAQYTFTKGKFAGEVVTVVPAWYLNALRGNQTHDELAWTDLTTAQQTNVINEMAYRAGGTSRPIESAISQVGADGSGASAGGNGTDITVTTGAGGTTGTGTGGNGGTNSLIGGVGGAATGAGTGGVGGAVVITAGVGGATTTSTGGAGGAITYTTGAGGAASGAGTGGAGGAYGVVGGAGGATTTSTGGAGSSITLTAGNGGAASGAGTGGAAGNIILAPGTGGTTSGGTAGKDGYVIIKGTNPRPFILNVTRSTIGNGGTLTAAQHQGQVLFQDASGGNVTMTTLSAANIDAAFPGLPVGAGMYLYVASNHASNTSTISGGSSVTLVGSGAVTQLGGTFLLIKTAATPTYDLVRVG